jgi:hypothetical protein
MHDILDIRGSVYGLQRVLQAMVTNNRKIADATKVGTVYNKKDDTSIEVGKYPRFYGANTTRCSDQVIVWRSVFVVVA